MNQAPRKPADARPSASLDAPDTSLDKAMQATLRPVHEMLKRIEKRLSRGSILDRVEADSDETIGGSIGAADDIAEMVDESICRNFEQFEPRLAEFHDALLSDLERIVTTVAPPPEPELETSTDYSAEVWQEILLGEHLCGIPGLATVREQLVNDILNGVDTAKTFAAQMLLVQAADVDEMPELLKLVGEAYYRWRPRTSIDEDPFEKALATWLTRQAENAGLPNSIQLVRPGERFERSRHLANGRGIEVVEVHGWVVLRDGNKVYTRANVSVR